MSRRFRFGVNVGYAGSRSEWAEEARKVEGLGYDVLTIPDHLVDLILAPIPALIAAAEATKRLRVGTNVLNNDLRHPVLLAREAATVDLLTDGRLQLGLGARSIRSEYEHAGLKFDRRAVRVERLAEAVVTVKGLHRSDKPFAKGCVRGALQHYLSDDETHVERRKLEASYLPSPALICRAIAVHDLSTRIIRLIDYLQAITADRNAVVPDKKVRGRMMVLVIDPGIVNVCDLEGSGRRSDPYGDLPIT